MENFNYHIIANLGANRERPGSLKVYDRFGRLVFGPVMVLGRGSNHASNNHNHTNQLMKNADTPSGQAKTQLIGPGASADSFGPYDRVWLYQGIEGNFLEAEKRGRSEILIHGGKQRSTKGQSWYPLHPTHGCMRLQNDDMKTLVETIKKLGSKGKITIL